MINALSLVGRQRAEFQHASKLRTWSLRLQLAIGILGICSVVVTNDVWLYILAVSGLASAALWLWLANETIETRAHAERIRRATMIAGGLGVVFDSVELLELANDGRASQAQADKLHDANYFSSARSVGVLRFLEMLEESAIWTTNLAKVAARETWGIFGISIIVVVFIVFCGLALFPIRQELIALRAFFAISAVILSTDFLGTAVSYDRARRETQRTIDRVQRLKETGASIEAAILIFAEYNAAVEGAPVFSNGLYPRHSKSLNAEYDKYFKTTEEVG